MCSNYKQRMHSYKIISLRGKESSLTAHEKVGLEQNAKQLKVQRICKSSLQEKDETSQSYLENRWCYNEYSVRFNLSSLGTGMALDSPPSWLANI